MNKSTKRVVAVAATGVLALAAATFSALPAFAVGTVLTGTVHVLNSSGTVIAANSAQSTTDPNAISGLQIDHSCNVPGSVTSAQGALSLYKADGTRVGVIGGIISASQDGTYGVTGLVSGETNVDMNLLNSGGTLLQGYSFTDLFNNNSVTYTSGAYQLRYVCSNVNNGFSGGSAGSFANSNYFEQDLTIDATANTWTIVGAKTATTTALSATTGVGSATFTATISPASGPTGTITVANGATTLCTITLPALSCTATGLADGNYSAIATYNGDSAYNGSSSSAYVFVLGAAGSVTGQITVVIPNQGNAGLTLTGTPSATINTTHTAGNRFTGSATIGTVEVKDERQVGAPTWHLQGTLSTLTKGTFTIPATDLGWVPALVGTPGAANALAAGSVLPSHTGGSGFDSTKPLASGDTPTNSAATTTDVNALLSVDTDGNKNPGSYVGTLTITLTAP